MHWKVSASRWNGGAKRTLMVEAESYDAARTKALDALEDDEEAVVRKRPMTATEVVNFRTPESDPR